MRGKHRLALVSTEMEGFSLNHSQESVMARCTKYKQQIIILGYELSSDVKIF